jgi:hypothetical protein
MNETTKPERDFIAIVRRCADLGIDFGFMLRAIEQEWKRRDATGGLAVIGVERLTAEIAQKTKLIDSLRQEVRTLRERQENLSPVPAKSKRATRKR